MSESNTKLTELQFTILDGMADDFEDIEQLYLDANRDFAEERRLGIEVPHLVMRVRFPLRDVIDEIATMLREGYIEAKYPNDDVCAPLEPINFAALHHYWFGPTKKGKELWKRYSAEHR